MNKTTNNILISIIVASAVLLLIPIVFMGAGFALTIAQEAFRASKISGIASEDIKDFSNGDYKIFFSKGGRGPNGDGTVQEIYSVNSDGTDLRFEKNESSQKWSEEVGDHRIIESMGEYYGEFQSQDGKKKLSLDHNWFVFSSKARLYLEKEGQKELIFDGKLEELAWLSDSKRIVFTEGDEKLGILDTETKQFSYLVDKNDGMFKITMLKVKEDDK